MSDLDVLLITPPSRIDVYQTLSNDYAAIEPPVWSMLIARYLTNLNYNVQILDAEAKNFNHEQTAKSIADKNPKLAVFVIYGQQPSASTQCMPAGAKTCNKLNSISNNEIKTLVMVLMHQHYLKEHLRKNHMILYARGRDQLRFQT